jgi:hypothetical protein
MLVMVLLLPLYLAMENGEFDKGGGSGSSGGPVTAVAAHWERQQRQRWQ